MQDLITKLKIITWVSWSIIIKTVYYLIDPLLRPWLNMGAFWFMFCDNGHLSLSFRLGLCNLLFVDGQNYCSEFEQYVQKCTNNTHSECCSNFAQKNVIEDEAMKTKVCWQNQFFFTPTITLICIKSVLIYNSHLR